MNTCRFCDQPARRILCGSPDCRRKYNAARAYRHECQCLQCGVAFRATKPTAKYCSTACAPRDRRRAKRLRRRALARAQAAAAGTAGDHAWMVDSHGLVRPVGKYELHVLANPREQSLSPLRAAVERGDSRGVVDALLACTRETSGGCREWMRRLDGNGYGKINVGSRTVGAHRLMAEAVHGPLHGQPVHHTCANRMCIAPAHLQPISERENIAEMIERNWYKRRIADLEEALAQVDPSHPLIARVMNSYMSCA